MTHSMTDITEKTIGETRGRPRKYATSEEARMANLVKQRERRKRLKEQKLLLPKADLPKSRPIIETRGRKAIAYQDPKKLQKQEYDRLRHLRKKQQEY